MKLSSLKQLIREAAVDAGTAAEQGLALFVGADAIILYDPDQLEQLVADNGPDAAEDHVGYIKGMLTFRSKPGAWGARHVTGSAAVPGYGPLVYDVAMAHVGGLIPDRGSVSTQAQRVWKVYATSRPDVRKKRIDDKDHPRTPPKVDDDYVHTGEENDVLDYAYFLDSPPNTSRMQRRHQTLMNTLSSTGFLTSHLLSAADIFFTRKYTGRIV